MLWIIVKVCHPVNLDETLSMTELTGLTQYLELLAFVMSILFARILIISLF